jgi:hypothetical protein
MPAVVTLTPPAAPAPATGTVVAAWCDAQSAWQSVRVAEGGATGTVEYLVSTALHDDSGNLLPVATVQANLAAALTAARAAQMTPRGTLTGLLPTQQV